MKFEQYQEEDGKNIINITVEKDDSEELKSDADSFIKGEERSHDHEANKEPEKENASTNKIEASKIEVVGTEEDKYKKGNYLLIFGIIITLLLLAALVYFYTLGY